MALNNRKSLRLKNYDYTSNGLYFVTICTNNKKHLFGSVHNNAMALNQAGVMIESIYNGLTSYINNIKLDNHITMPNHFHAIISIDTPLPDSMNIDYFNQNLSPSLSYIIQTFKRRTTLEYIKLVNKGVCPRFDKRLWQRNYYDHIIRSENDYQDIWEYINNNPLKWDLDEYYS